MALTHIGPKGPDRCRAKTAGSCPFFPPEDHFESQEQAQEEYERRADRFGGVVRGLSSARSLSPIEKQRLEKANALIKNYSNRRAEKYKDLVVAMDGQKMDAARAQARVTHLLGYAEKQNNSNLAKTIRNSKILSSGSLRSKSTGNKRINVNSVLEDKRNLNEFGEAKAAVIKGYADSIQNSPLAKEKKAFSYAIPGDGSLNNATTVKVTFDGYSEENFSKLSGATRKALKTTKASPSSSKAYEAMKNGVITREQYEAISTKTTTMNYVSSTPRGKDEGFKYNPNGKAFTIDASNKEKTAELISKSVTNVHKEYRSQYGESVKQATKRLGEKSAAFKGYQAKHNSNLIVPGRSVGDAAIISGKTVINPSKAKETLTPEQYKAILEPRETIDHEKAKMMLPPKQYAEIFENAKVSVTVRERVGVRPRENRRP